MRLRAAPGCAHAPRTSAATACRARNARRQPRPAAPGPGGLPRAKRSSPTGVSGTGSDVSLPHRCKRCGSWIQRRHPPPAALLSSAEPRAESGRHRHDRCLHARRLLKLATKRLPAEPSRAEPLPRSGFMVAASRLLRRPVGEFPCSCGAASSEAGRSCVVLSRRKSPSSPRRGSPRRPGSAAQLAARPPAGAHGTAPGRARASVPGPAPEQGPEPEPGQGYL